jgi:hypothetical protein
MWRTELSAACGIQDPTLPFHKLKPLVLLTKWSLGELLFRQLINEADNNLAYVLFEVQGSIGVERH